MSSPTTRRNSTMKGSENIDRYWVPNDEDVWSPCLCQHVTAEKVFLLAPSGKILEWPAEKLQDLDHAVESQIQGVDDICELSFVNEGALLHTVRVRYQENLIYTRVARIIIAVNPFQSLPIYSAQVLDTYKQASETMALPPHIFAVGQEAMLGLRNKFAADRIILISGESGAGKTESAKLILSFVSGAATTGKKGGVEEIVVQTNAIFEAFGNAMTLRNNNSSRFGKLLDIRFSSSMRMLGCTLTNYLLETTRVCRQSKKERNYHIFYQLLKARCAEEGTLPAWAHEHLLQMNLLKPDQYRYLQGLNDAPGIDDIDEFHHLLAAFKPLGFSEVLQCEIFTLLAGILTLGNCEFQLEKDKAVVASSAEQTLEDAAKLLGIDSSALQKCMLVKKLKVANEVTIISLTDVQAKSVKETLSRILYGRLFDWLKNMMNKALDENSATPVRHACLGVLDIAGFESLEKNSLEQLLINLSNEHLQKSFNDTIFKSELDDYAAEGVVLPSTITFKDNSEILDLIDGKTGILAILDDDMAMGKASDTSFTAKIQKSFEKHARLIIPRFNKTMSFGVSHFAGEVMYNTDGFLEKNSEKMPDDVANLLAGSTLELVQSLGVELQGEAAEAESGRRGSGLGGGKGRQKSSSFMFRTSLRALTTKISNSERHYIRCIKPNSAKVAKKFESKSVMEQLLLSGILEAVHIRQQGYCTRLLFGDFFFRYRAVVDYQKKGQASPSRVAWDKDDQTNARVLVERIKEIVVEIDSTELAIGKTKIFATQSATSILEHKRSDGLFRVARLMQAKVRTFVVLRQMKAKRAVHASIQKWLVSVKGMASQVGVWSFPAGSALEALESDEAGQQAVAQASPLLAEASNVRLENGTVSAAQRWSRRIQNELDTVIEIDRLAKSVDPMAIEQALARSVDLELPERPAWSLLRQRLRALEVQLPLIKFMEDVLALAEKPSDKDVPDLDTELGACMGAVDAAGLFQRPQDFLPELGGSELLDKVSAIHEVFTEVQSLQTSIDMTAIDAALLKYKELGFPDTQAIQKLRTRLDALKVQQPLVNSLQTIFTAEGGTVGGSNLASMFKDTVEKIIAADLHTNLEKWVPELSCTELVKDAMAQHAALLELENVNSSTDLAAVGDALRQARTTGLRQSIASIVEHRFIQLKVQLPLVYRMQRVLESEVCPDDELEALLSDIRAEGLDSGKHAWLPELDGETLMQKILPWHETVLRLQALMTSVDAESIEAALQTSIDLGLPQRGTPTKLVERLKQVKFQSNHIKAITEFLKLDGATEEVPDPDVQLRQVMQNLEDAELTLQSEVSWLPEFEAEQFLAPLSARLSALELLEAAALSLEPDVIESALDNASQAALAKGKAAKAAVERRQLLTVQLPLIASMDAVVTCDVGDQDESAESDYDERLKGIAGQLVANGYPDSPEIWLEGLPGPALCVDVMKRYDALLTIEGLLASTDPKEIESALLHAQGLGLPKGAATRNLESRCAQLHLELPLLDAMKDALAEEGPYDGDRLKQVMAKIEDLQKQRGSQWLPDLGASQLVADVSTRHEVLLELEALFQSTDVEAIKKVLARAHMVGLSSCLATSKLEQRLPTLSTQLDLVYSMRRILHGKTRADSLVSSASKSTSQDFDEQVNSIAIDLVRERLDQHPKNWLPEINDGFILAKGIMKLRAAIESLNRAAASVEFEVLSQALEKAREAEIPDGGASQAFAKVTERHSMLVRLAELLTSVDIEIIKSGLVQGGFMGLAESDEVLLLTQRLNTLQEQLPLVASLKETLSGNASDCDSHLQAVYMDVLNKSPTWLAELPGPSLTAEVEVRYNALVALEGLSKSVDVEAIKEALRHAESVSLPVGTTTANMTSRLEKLEKQLPHVKSLEEVLQKEADGEDRVDLVAQLKRTLVAAEEAGLKSCEDWLPEVSGAELVQTVTRKASQTKAEVRASRMIWAAKQHRERRSTISSKHVTDQATLLEKIQIASDRYDARELASLLGQVAKYGLDASDVLQYRLILQQLQSEGFITRTIAETVHEVEKGEPQTRDMWRLINLSDQLQALGGDSDLVRKTRMTITVASRQTRLLEKGDAGAAAIEVLFSDLCKVPILKKDATMVFQRSCISESLTKVDQEFQQNAIQNFRNILTWMTDRPASDVERQSAVDGVVRLLRTVDALRDEIYVQLLKQLHHNPSLRSAALGWELLTSLCRSMLPSDRLFDYLKMFLDRHAEGSHSQFQIQAKRCLKHVEELQNLPRLRGILFKSRPEGRRTREFDRRYFVLRNMHLFWYKTQNDAERAESASPDGGPLCKGYLSFAATSCKVECTDENAIFTIEPLGPGWSKGRLSQEDRSRIFRLDASEAEQPRNEWVAAIRKHIQQSQAGLTTRIDEMVSEFFMKAVADNDKDKH